MLAKKVQEALTCVGATYGELPNQLGVNIAVDRVRRAAGGAQRRVRKFVNHRQNPDEPASDKRVADKVQTSAEVWALRQRYGCSGAVARLRPRRRSTRSFSWRSTRSSSS